MEATKWDCFEFSWSLGLRQFVKGRQGVGVKHLFGGGWKFSTLLTPFLEYRTPLISMNPPSPCFFPWGCWMRLSFGVSGPRYTLYSCVSVWGWRWEFSPQAGQGKFLHFEASSWESRRHGRGRSGGCMGISSFLLLNKQLGGSWRYGACLPGLWWVIWGNVAAVGQGCQRAEHWGHGWLWGGVGVRSQTSRHPLLPSPATCKGYVWCLWGSGGGMSHAVTGWRVQILECVW